MHHSSHEIKWYDMIGKDKAKMLIKKSFKDGRKILEFLDSLDVPVYVVPGNADLTPDKTEKWSLLRQNHYKKLPSMVFLKKMESQ